MRSVGGSDGAAAVAYAKALFMPFGNADRPPAYDGHRKFRAARGGASIFSSTFSYF